MRILLLTAYFPPDTGSAAHLFYELGCELVSRGHQVQVITNMPGYHAVGADDRYQGKRWLKESLDGMDVYRIASLRLSPTSMVGRAMWQFGMAFAFFLVGLLVPKADISLVYSPPLTLGFSAWGLRIFRGIKFIFNVQDLFPQSIIDLGLLRNPQIIRIFEWMEKTIYKRSNGVAVHSTGNQEHVVRRGGEPKHVQVIPNWVDTDFIQPGERQNEFRAVNNFGDDFLVSFAGVLGYSQDLDVIIDAAKLLRGQDQIQWVLVGDGVEKERMQAKARELELLNRVHFVPMQPREKYPAILHASDVCLATLRAEVTTPVVPSKILSIMAAGKPVVAAMNLSGDAPKLISDAQCGFSTPPGDATALAEVVLKLYTDRDLCAQVGANGRQYAEEHLSRKACVSHYERIIMEILQSG